MFTERFLKIPIKTCDSKSQDLGIDINEKDVVIRLDPNQIESYYKDWKDDQEVVLVTAKSGDNFYAFMKLKEFEKLLNEFNNGN